MKRIVVPTCDGCGQSEQGWFQDDSWGLHFCYYCLYGAAGFFCKHGLLESNVLCELLFDGVWRTTDSTYEVWCRSLSDSKASSQCWIERLAK